MSDIILEMRNITKTFPGVKALDNVNLAVAEAEIHALVGENGAGKSTLMKVLSGVYPHGSYEGDIVYRGQTCRFKNISDSEKLGIIIIHQELALVPLLSIAKNIFLGNEPARRGVIDRFGAISRTRDLLKKVGLNEAPDTLVTDIGVGKQQLVEIAKALAKKVRLLILDEPTASLNETDSEALLGLLLEFKAQGIASILISHKLNEISKIADSVTILRDGATIETLDAHQDELSEARIIRGMVGRELTHRYPERNSNIGETMFELKHWNAYHPLHAERQIVKDVSLHVKKGEVVGVAGLMGSGRTELAMSVFGRSYGRRVSGEALLHGRKVDISTIGKAIAHGVAYVTEDRKAYGLILDDDIRHNVTLANLEAVTDGFVIDANKELVAADSYREKLGIRCSSVLQETVNLSGGNQQKVVLSKWLFADPEVLMLDEPTRGIDVGAKYEIYTLINGLAAEGKGILLISSELPEILGVCDRIYVMNEGRMVSEMTRAEASQEKIMREIVTSSGGGRSVSSLTAREQKEERTLGIGTLFRRNVRQYGMLIALIAIMLFFQVRTDGVLLKPLNLTNLILQNSYIVIMAIGMLLVIVAGHIDLSVGSIVGFVGALAAIMMVNYHIHWAITLVACLAVGALIGAAQGYWVAFLGIPSFIVTLAGMLVFRGLSLALLQGQSVGPFPETFQKLSSGFIPDVFQVEGLHFTSLLLGGGVALALVFLSWRQRRNQQKYSLATEPFAFFVLKNAVVAGVLFYLCYLLASYRGLPNVLIIMFALIVLYSFVTTQTTVGRRIYALGGNVKAAKLSGVKTERLTFLTFVNLGVLAALAGMVFAARLNTATPKAGNAFELDVIAAAFIGGASATGGVGTVVGAVVGAFVMGVMNNGMSILGVGIDWQQVIKGLVLLLAVFFDVYNRRRAG